MDNDSCICYKKSMLKHIKNKILNSWLYCVYWGHTIIESILILILSYVLLTYIVTLITELTK